MILPFMLNRDEYEGYRFDQPWNSPHNLAFAEAMEEGQLNCHYFHCPSDRESDIRNTSYVMVVGPKTISDGPTSTRMKDFTDRISVTIMIAEMSDSGIHWMEPRDLSYYEMTFRINASNGKGVRSKHPYGVNVVFFDSTVRFIEDNIDPLLLKGLLIRDGGEDVRRFYNSMSP